MEILKSSLKQVPKNERVKGRVYGISDDMEGELSTFSVHGEDDSDWEGMRWLFWFAIPESMLPVREVMPEVGQEYEFSDDGVNWFKRKLKGFGAGGSAYGNIRPISTNPAQTLSIPAGTKAEQVEYLRGVIATMEGGGV
jgi:hypothetical protein